MRVSEACIAFIKNMEGFIQKPVWDYAQYSVGYGCRCNQWDYPNGITETEADVLLRREIVQFEDGINAIGPVYTQNQFDALVSFSFNVGLSWTKTPSYRIYKLAHGENYTDAEVFDIFGSWNKAGGQVLAGLVRRRNAEARMWLYGEGSAAASVNPEQMTEEEIRKKVVNIMRGWVGCQQGDKVHHSIIDTYNRIKPLPMGYRLSYGDAWCAATVSAAGYLAGVTEIVYPHMNCGSMVSLYKKAGRWVEDDAYVPAPGDLVIYDWSDDGGGDCTAHASHVGMVERCNGKEFTVIEGNMGANHICGRRTMQVNGRYIRGFCCPDYASAAKKHGKEDIDMTRDEVIQLIDQRIKAALEGDGTTPSQWAQEELAKAQAAGITDGTRPKGYATREEVAAMVLRSMTK